MWRILFVNMIHMILAGPVEAAARQVFSVSWLSTSFLLKRGERTELPDGRTGFPFFLRALLVFRN